MEGQTMTAFNSFVGKQPCWSIMNLAQSYLDSALILCREIRVRDNHRYGAIFFLMPIVNALHQGMENFLKGASLRLNEDRPPMRTHDLEKLWKDYKKRLKFSRRSTDLLIDHKIIEDVSWWDKNASKLTGPGEGPRFLHGKEFLPSYRGLTVPEEHLQKISRQCKNESVRVHLRLIQEFIPANPIHMVHPLQPWWEPDNSFENRVNERKRELRIERSISTPATKEDSREIVTFEEDSIVQ